jgi:hypothetical protein
VRRYLIERRFTGRESFPVITLGSPGHLLFTENNALEGVTWLHTYVSVEKHRWFCLYDAPSPESIRRAAYRNMLPIHEIHEIGVLDPHALVL